MVQLVKSINNGSIITEDVRMMSEYCLHLRTAFGVLTWKSIHIFTITINAANRSRRRTFVWLEYSANQCRPSSVSLPTPTPLRTREGSLYSQDLVGLFRTTRENLGSSSEHRPPKCSYAMKILDLTSFIKCLSICKVCSPQFTCILMYSHQSRPTKIPSKRP